LEYIDNLLVFEKDLYYDLIAEAVANEKQKSQSQSAQGMPVLGR